MSIEKPIDIALLYEHPEWHRPLFDALDAAGVAYEAIDLTTGAFAAERLPNARLYYNLVSPSAYVRGHQRSIPYAWALCRTLEIDRKMVVNGTRSMGYEFSKSAQIALLRTLGIDHPRTITFNSVEALRAMASSITFPRIMKPEQGGSGARMYRVDTMEEIETLLERQPELWLPDNLLLLQEKLEYDASAGIVRMEYIGGTLLYAMRVVTNGAFNLCPSPLCNPEEEEDGVCEVVPEARPEFHAFTDVPDDAVAQGAAIMRAAGHSIGSVEYLTTHDGRRVFYDINSNSNLRESIALAFGKHAFQEVVAYLAQRCGLGEVTHAPVPPYRIDGSERSEARRVLC